MTALPAPVTRAVLDRYGVLDAGEDPDLRAIARLAAHVAGVPTATVNLLDADSQYNLASEGFQRSVRPVAESMCVVTVRHDGPVHVPDASRDARWADNPWVSGELGSIRFYAASPLHSVEGEVLGTLCVFDDAVRTLDDDQRRALDELAEQLSQWLELRRRARALESAVTELERSNAELSAFAGRAAHDLRNPLTAVIGYLQLLDRRFGNDLGDAGRTVIANALRAANRMTDLVVDLLAYAAVGATPALVPVNLSAVAADVLTDLQPAVDASGGTVSVGALPGVETEPTLVRQLVQNLLANALKFTRAGDAPAVEITGGREGDGSWWLSVADRGPGIQPADRERVFEPFTRTATAVGLPGSGIGLATCARIATTLGGSLEVGETAGGGATFTLRVPSGGNVEGPSRS